MLRLFGDKHKRRRGKDGQPVRLSHELPSASKLPDLTLDPEGAEELRHAFQPGKHVLEYGSGGSTVLAIQQGCSITSVENARDWAHGVEASIAAHYPEAALTMHCVDTGPIGDWGKPIDSSGWPLYPDYPLSVWDRPDFIAPDVVFIDGRFRLGCFLATLFRTQKDVLLLWDDYPNRRESYGLAESFVPLSRITGRVAVFEVSPASIPSERLHAILKAFQSPL